MIESKCPYCNKKTEENEKGSFYDVNKLYEMQEIPMPWKTTSRGLTFVQCSDCNNCYWHEHDSGSNYVHKISNYYKLYGDDALAYCNNMLTKIVTPCVKGEENNMEEWLINVPVVYTAGPFRAKNGNGDFDNEEVKRNIQHAIAVSQKLIDNGIMVMCPHANTHFKMPKSATPELFLRGDLKLVMACDVMLMLDGWEKSEGSKLEHSFAKFIGMPIYYETKILCDEKIGDAQELITEDNLSMSGVRQDWLVSIDCDDFKHKSISALIKDKEKLSKYPQQFMMFRILQAMGYYLHVSKNHDYSPMNMKGTGQVGGATRLWDKCARYLNLIGFNLETGEFKGQKNPKNESIDDTLSDLANYAYINFILGKGYWGK